MEIKDVGNRTYLEKLIHASDRKKAKPKRKSPPAAGAKTKQNKVTLTEDVRSSEKISQYVEIVKNMPDIRPEEIERVKKELAEGAYDTDMVLKKTAEKILEEFS